MRKYLPDLENTRARSLREELPLLPGRKAGVYSTCIRMEREEETDCRKCIHKYVCNTDLEILCVNYHFGNSIHKGCHSCTNYYARTFTKDKLKCFWCSRFIHEDRVYLSPDGETEGNSEQM